MKKKIEDALRTEYAGLGLSDKTIGRLADYVLGSVEKEEDIVTAVKGDAVKLIAKSIQGEIDGIQKAKKKAEDDLAEYKAKHPEPDDDNKGDDDDKGEKKIDWAATLEAAIAKAVTPLTEKISALENANSTKAALTGAREIFFGGDYAKKYKDEANDAWDRAVEMNEATGSKMTAEQLAEKASGYFNKAVARKGVDTSKPFVADPPKKDEEGVVDWSAEKKRLQESGRLPKEN
ncbi:MAG: hypothetical protein II489_10510 [Bacteroidaceae bacterium]|nr:hypothetical protein [Bacteroidaceae bacterium]